jgi:hypothetical protein
MSAFWEANKGDPPSFQISPNNHNWIEGDCVPVTGLNGFTVIYFIGKSGTKGNRCISL